MDINKEWDSFVEYLRTKGVVKIGRNALGVITNLVREGSCSLGYNDIELMWETWQAKAQAVPAEFEIDQLKDRISDLLDERQDLYAQLDAEAVPEWISVENTTPNKNGDYIVCIDGEPCSAFFKWVNDHWKEFKVGAGITEGIHGWWHTHLNVTHWMPLPKPPKAQEPAND